MRNPIESMIDACVSCTNCGTKGIGNCDCWGDKFKKGELMKKPVKKEVKKTILKKKKK